MIAVAKAGYRAIAYDFRGYGLSEKPAEPEKGGFMDLVEDTVSLLDTLGISKVMMYRCHFSISQVFEAPHAMNFGSN